jgi:hypothetical protein
VPKRRSLVSDKPEALSRSHETDSVSYRELPTGTSIELRDGTVAEVTGNPQDGVWLLVKILDCPSDPSRVGADEMVFFTDVA